MAATTDHVRSAVQRLAGALLEDVERIAGRSVARMQELLPSYAKVPADALLPVTLTNTRNLLEAIRDPDADPTPADRHFSQSGETRLTQGITADEMLQAWRIGLETVREEAHPVAKGLEVTDAALLEFVEATLRWGDLGMRSSAAAHREGELRQIEWLAAEQSALRRVAELVARQAPPERVFALVNEELSHVLGADLMARTVRFESDGTATILAARGGPEDLLPPGTNTPRPEGGILDQVLATGRPGRVDDYALLSGPLAVALHGAGIRSAAAGPIVVDGRTWGAMAVGSGELLPPGTEYRVTQFSELVSTAISNIESRARVEQLAAEQAALRRVAELVARQAAPEQVFGLVTEELNRLLDAGTVGTGRFESDGTVTIMAVRGTAQDAFPPGANVALEGGSAIEQVLRTGRPAHIENYDSVGGQLGTVMRKLGAGWAAAGLIVVDGRLWGAMTVNSGSSGAYPAGAEQRVAQFAELVSTAISNIESRARVEQLAAEQAALRRVAELVAQQAPPDQVFALVTQELSLLLGARLIRTVRSESDGTTTVVASLGKDVDRLPPGTSVTWPRGSVTDEVLRTSRPARLDDYARLRGPIAAILHEEGVRCAAGGPIIVDGRLWGAMVVASDSVENLPPGSEDRVAQFAELVSTAISNIESRAKVERLAAEQSALRRVATLVAREHSPEDLFATLVEELGVLLQVDATAILRYEADASATVVAGWSDGTITLPVGERLPLEGENLAREVHRTGSPRRKEDYSGAPGVIAATVRELGIRSAVASPIVVEGVTWGVIAVLSRRPEALPSDTEARIAEFTQQAGLAVANAKSRADLAQSRARLVRAADEARRRFERDLHDGAQQRLVSLGLELRPGRGDSASRAGRSPRSAVASRDRSERCARRPTRALTRHSPVGAFGGRTQPGARFAGATVGSSRRTPC